MMVSAEKDPRRHGTICMPDQGPPAIIPRVHADLVIQRVAVPSTTQEKSK